MRKFGVILHALAVSALGSADSAAQTTVYEDAFDNDTLATNAGTGGGMTTAPLYSATENLFVDDGDLHISGGNSARRGVATTVNAFDVSGGFTLTFVANNPNDGGGGYVDVCLTKVRLADDFAAVGTAEGIFTNFPGAAAGDQGSSRYGFGVAMGNWYADGPRFNDGTGTDDVSILEVATPGEIANGATVSLTVNPDDSWSYSVAGSVVASGADFVTGAAVVDLSAPMYVNAYGQPNAEFGSITLTVPDSTPASLQIISITSVGDDMWELELEGEASTDYEFYLDATLGFDPGDLIENLVQGAKGIVSGDNNEVFTTDSSGDGRVQVGLSGTKNFVRAQTVL